MSDVTEVNHLVEKLNTLKEEIHKVIVGQQEVLERGVERGGRSEDEGDD